MNWQLLPQHRVSIDERAAMFTLLDRHFANVTREQFDADLDEKNWVIVLRDGEKNLCGFTTLCFESHDCPEAGPCHVVTSGDTIVNPQAWGSSALLRAWLHGVLSLRARHNALARPVYWLLITSGYRTYRFMPLFWRSYYPRCGAPTPAHVQRRIDALACARYGNAYNASSGVVRLPQPQRLRPHLEAIPESRHDDPHIAFFLERNPGHGHGDELVSLTEICESNLTRAGHRILRARATHAEMSA